MNTFTNIKLVRSREIERRIESGFVEPCVTVAAYRMYMLLPDTEIYRKEILENFVNKVCMYQDAHGTRTDIFWDKLYHIMDTRFTTDPVVEVTYGANGKKTTLILAPPLDPELRVKLGNTFNQNEENDYILSSDPSPVVGLR